MKALIFVAALALMAVAARGQSCNPYWLKPAPFDHRSFGLTYSVFGPSSAAIDFGPHAGLYASGSDPSRPPNQRVFAARWRGQGWEALTSGMGFVESFQFLISLDDGAGPKPHAAGRYFDPATGFTYRSWKWETDQWVDTPPGFVVPFGPDNARPMFSMDDGRGMAIYGFRHATVCKWSGSEWKPMGGPFVDFGPLTVAPADFGNGPRLVAVGRFSAIGANLVQPGAVVWDGGRWIQLGQTFGADDIRGFDVFDDGFGPHIYVGGFFSIDGTTRSLIRFDGHVWSSVLGAPAGIRNVKQFNDGTGSPGLFVTGDFAAAGSVPATRIAKFDGRNWQALGAGSGYYSDTMVVFDDGRGPSLFVTMGGGSGSPVGGGTVSAGIAQWVGCPNCYANCDNSTSSPQLTANDFMCFLNRYTVRDPYANCTVDEVINVADFQCFLSKFALGCP